jgi:H+/Cl- antiporter ClcA
MKDSSISRLLKVSQSMQYRLIIEGAGVGLISGAVVSFYRWILAHAEQFSKWMYTAVKTSWVWMVLVFLGLVVLGIVCGFLVRSEPMIKGSGIPQVEGELLGYFNPSWWKVLLKKFAGGVIAIGAGLSLGREGPSIQLGASVGKGLSNVFHRIKFEEKYLMTCGASAGLAAAFNAPLAGVMFAMEEVHKSFSPNVMLSAMAAAIAGDLVSKSIFGMSSVFDTVPTDALPMRFYLLLVVLGCVLGIFGAVYNKTLLKTQDLYQRIPIPDWVKPVIPFLLAGLLGMMLPAVLGGGHGIITGLIENKYLIGSIALLLVVKFVFSMVSFGSGVPGGIFFPLLVLGALVGVLFGKVSVLYFGLPEMFVVKFMLLGMVGLFTAIVRAPVTGIILIVEMSGSLSHLLALTVVTIFSYVVATALGAKPIYESLLERMTGKGADVARGEKVLVRMVVNQASRAQGRSMRQLRFPKNCLVVSIDRLGEEVIPDGSTQIHAGDVVMIMCDQKDEPKIRETVSRIFSRE